jgi:hypothetical protein
VRYPSDLPSCKCLTTMLGLLGIANGRITFKLSTNHKLVNGSPSAAT